MTPSHVTMVRAGVVADLGIRRHFAAAPPFASVGATLGSARFWAGGALVVVVLLVSLDVYGLFEQIRKDHDREWLSIRKLARRHGVHDRQLDRRWRPRSRRRGSVRRADLCRSWASGCAKGMAWRCPSGRCAAMSLRVAASWA